MKRNVLVNAKAYAALVGSVATALLTVYVGNEFLTAVSVAATAVATWRVPNAG
jgi:hypothetical protein